ncbi:MAG: CDP-diacylglycerol--serine O-phosphatidyltransferase [bacterium]
MMLKRRLVPSFFTFLNFFWGFFSIVKTLEGNLHAAAWFIILAILCDGMDGKLARWTSSETSFGFELDSLADLISAGLAPAMLAYRGGFDGHGFMGMVLCFLYAFAGGYRLARFNVVQAGDRSRGYIGLPIPIAGLTVASLWLFEPPFGFKTSVIAWIILLVALEVLMISSVRYDWPRISFKDNWRNTLQSVGILCAVGLMAFFPQWSLFPLFVLYVVLGVRVWAVALARGEASLTDFFLTVKSDRIVRG